MIETRDLVYNLFRQQLAVIKTELPSKEEKKKKKLQWPNSYILFLYHLFCYPYTSLFPLKSPSNKHPAPNHILPIYLNFALSVPGLGSSDTVTWIISASHDVTDGATKALLTLKDSQCSPSAACDIQLFLICFSHSHLCHLSDPHVVTCHVQQFLMSCLMFFLQHIVFKVKGEQAVTILVKLIHS